MLGNCSCAGTWEVRGNTAGGEVQRGGGALIRGHCRSGKDLDSVPCDGMVRPPGGFKRKKLRSGAYFNKVILAAFWRVKSGDPIIKFSPVQVKDNIKVAVMQNG